MSKGRVYLVGAGPGDPGLITVRGRELLARADVVVYDYLASQRLVSYARPDAELIYVGKQANRHTMPQEQINELLVSLAGRGSMVVRLKGGDPFIFGRGGEEALALVEAGHPFEVVPGITAAVAAAAYAGIPVTHRNVASNFGLVTGHETPDKPDSNLDYDALAKWQGTLAFYMGVANLETICTSLAERGLSENTPAALIQWGTTSRQRTVTGTVGNAARLARQEDIKPPAMIVIGEVVKLRDKLKWYELRPLFGRRIVVTRARTQASALTFKLEQLGADVIETPTIRIEPPLETAELDNAAAEAGSFDWIVFTSVNGVEAFFAALARAGKDARALAGCRICTIGPATAEALGRFGLTSDAQPAKFTGTETAATLASVEDLTGARVLCPRADIAPRELIDALAAHGASVCEVTAYRTVAEDAAAAGTAELLKEDQVNWITFTSSSTVRNFFSVIDPEAVRGCSVRLASIGPVTTATLREFGFTPTAEADVHTIEGLVDAIVETEATGA